MSLSRKIAGNTLVQIAGRMAGTAIGLVTVVIMTRELGPGGYGGFTTVISYLQFFGILVDFGLTITMTKMIAAVTTPEEETRVASNVFTFRLVTAAVFFAIAPVLGFFFPYSVDVRNGIFIAAFSFFFAAVSGALGGIFQKHLATGLAAASEVISRTVLLALVWLAARAGAGLGTYVLALTVSNLVQMALMLTHARRFVTLRFDFDRSLWSRIFRESWPIGVSIIFNLVYLKGDVILLSLTRSQEEVGLYGAAYKVLDVVTVFPMFFMGLVLPLLTAAWSSGDRAAYARRFLKSFDVLAIAALPLAVGAWPTARDLMTLVAGEAFADSGRMLAVLMLAASSVTLATVSCHAVVAVGIQKPMIWMYAIDALLSLALYLLYVPVHGPIAAAWITVFSEAFILVIATIAVARYTRVSPGWRAFGAASLASAVMYGALVAASTLHVLLRITLGMFVYGSALLALSGTARGLLRDFLKPRTAKDTDVTLDNGKRAAGASQV